ncbi:GAF and ANTAR domain-containing protein [Acidiferrimicrobium sp. IK]|uniref:ANTAR domain-containing protein n=1 Tax=Acidiferrimicrobium sp. IK TaxID=2871700 RepID=UPI0021CB3E5A|nr:ANTAR domain-containing protein [Acidiferrimicrobium sp. IK]MCU4185395.1 GAF and ANTAR domain-containing protein [Acidiferrimicrobium sp. IK]
MSGPRPEVASDGASPSGPDREHRPGALSLILSVAVTAVPDVHGASVSLRGRGAEYATIEASSSAARKIDEVQYRDGGGPCVAAIETGAEQTLALPSGMWSAFSEAAGAAGICSVWSLPLATRPEAPGSLNLYSMTGEPWRDRGAQTARLLALMASAALGSAEELADARESNANLREALQTRTVIGQAQGVLMSRQGVPGEEAFDILRRASQRSNRKLRDVAAEIVAGFDRPQEDPRDVDA